MQFFPWIVAFATVGLLATVLSAWAVKSAPKRTRSEMPTEWALMPRSVFSLDERRVYRLLREALPHHVVLAKLPLVRFCQATEPSSGRYWYDLLGAAHVTFAVCSPNGRVLAAIDLDNERQVSRRVTQIKQSVLAACRVRYLRCPVDHPPSIAELQLLVPSSAAAMRGPHAAPLSAQRSGAPRRADQPTLWEDSIAFHDSFFGPDSRSGAFGASEFMSSPSALPQTGSRTTEPGAPEAEPDARFSHEVACADTVPPAERPEAPRRRRPPSESR